MTNIKNIAFILELLEGAEKNIKTIHKLLTDELANTKKSTITPNTQENNSIRVIEGVFDGQNMIGNDNKIYPVIANYASKSKLVEGDHLKLTILEDGSFVFKQIFPVPRKSMVGLLTYDDGKYKVIAGGKAYRVLNASVTYYKAKPGDEVTIIVNAADDNTQWAALDNVITKNIPNDEGILLDKKKLNRKTNSEDDFDDNDNIDYHIDI